LQGVCKYAFYGKKVFLLKGNKYVKYVTGGWGRNKIANIKLPKFSIHAIMKYLP
jgi:hypothetical protein